MLLAPIRAHDDLDPPTLPGAFAWWYLDLVDERGDGLVLIWGFALPFLDPPEDAQASQHPFLNLCVYQGGVCTCYHLEQIAPEAARRDGDAWRFADSRFLSKRRGDDWIVEADLDLPLAGSTDRVRAQIRSRGPVVRLDREGHSSHRWAPLSMPAQGEARIERDGGWSVELKGRVYHDRNTCDEPLPNGGIREWAWGRVALPDAELIHYACWPEAADGALESISVRVEADGTGRVVDVPMPVSEGRRGGFWGFPSPVRLRVADGLGGELPLSIGKAVDESPFYLRFPLACEGGRGWGERVRPASIRLPWMKPLVRMRVRWPEGSHVLLPVFSGPRTDRVARTIAGWWS